MRKSIAHELTKEEASDIERNQLMRYQKRLHYRRADMAGTVTEIRDELGFAQADDFEAGAYLARWQAEDQARELGAEEAYREVAARRDYSLGEVSPEHIRGLYGSTLNLSASQVDKQAECRLAYFLRYGLRAKEPDRKKHDRS